MARPMNGFRFGLEAEYLLVEAGSFRPLWHPDLSFDRLDAALSAVETGDLPPLDGLCPLPPHGRVTPYLVEGYHVPDPAAPGATLLPKGVEIRTPVCGSIDETLSTFAVLYGRMQDTLAGLGMRAVALSHHPTEDQFEGSQGGRRFDYWLWAKQAMLTFGPDVNVSLPGPLAGRLDTADLWEKVNHYAPALTGLTLASPLFRGDLWRIRGAVGKSLRTYRRGVSGQALELHPEQRGRLEFKSFEMTHRLEDFRGYLLLWLALLLDDGLAGRASDQTRVYDFGAVARDGLESSEMRGRVEEVLDRAPAVLARRGFDPATLGSFRTRLETRRLPADEIVDHFRQTRDLTAVLRRLSVLETDTAGVACETAGPHGHRPAPRARRA